MSLAEGMGQLIGRTERSLGRVAPRDSASSSDAEVDSR